MAGYAPRLHIAETRDRVRLSLGGLVAADGPTLQDAADELVRKALLITTWIRSSDVRWSFDLPPDPTFEYLWHLGDVAAAGGDIRELLFDPAAAPS